MSRIFLSHSSLDNVLASRLHRALQARGYAAFLDLDTRQGIEAGERWKNRLYLELRRCDALLILWSRQSQESRWCTAEIAVADALGKPIFPLRADDASLDPVLAEHQSLRLARDASDEEVINAVERLCQGLRLAGIDAISGPSGTPVRPPYPGLASFEADDEPHYFGRVEAIAAGREALQRLREQDDGDGLLLITGASGVGKSSLLRAGWLPRLRRDATRWAVAGPIRPGREPFTNLVAAMNMLLHDAMGRAGTRPTSAVAQILDSLDATARRADRGEGPGDLSSLLLSMVREVRRLPSRERSTVLVAIDQFEELFDPAVAELRSNFLGVLARLQRDGSKEGSADASAVALAGTVRADGLNVLSSEADGFGLRVIPQTLLPLARAQLREAIVRPALRSSGVTLSDDLVETLLDDAGIPPALPLIGFALEQLWGLERSGDELNLEHYRHIGGVHGAIAAVADRALRATSAAAGRGIEELRPAFLMMVRVAPETPGGFRRRRADWAELPEGARPALRALADSRLLVIDRDSQGRTTIEVAHEALFTAWKPLVHWLSATGSALALQQELESDAREWEAAQKGSPGKSRSTSSLLLQWHDPDAFLAAINAVEAVGASEVLLSFLLHVRLAAMERLRNDIQQISDRSARLHFEQDEIEFDDSRTRAERAASYERISLEVDRLRDEQARLRSTEGLFQHQAPVFERWRSQAAASSALRGAAA